MLGTLNVSCFPSLSELIVNNCCSMLCSFVFIPVLSVARQIKLKLWSLSQSVVIPCWPNHRTSTSPFILCLSVLLNAFLSCSLAFSSSNWFYNLIVQHIFRSSAASCCTQCSGPLSFSSCDLPLGYLSCKHTFDCHFYNPGRYYLGNDET